MNEQTINFLNVLPIGTKLDDLESECEYIGEVIKNEHQFQFYKYSEEFEDSIYGLKPMEKPLLYFNLNVLSRVEYLFDIAYFKDLYKGVNKYLPIGEKFKDNPLNCLDLDCPDCSNNYSFSSFNNIFIGLIKTGSTTALLKIADHNFFHN